MPEGRSSRPGSYGALGAGLWLGVVAGWNVANVGAIADRLADDYGVALGTIGLLTTALFVTHFSVQIPAGKAIDRFGARRVGLAAAALVALANLAPLLDRTVALALAARVVVGVGSGAAFVAGSDYMRAASGSPLAQGIYGGVAVSSGGLALAVVPLVAGIAEWRAPFITASATAALVAVLLLFAPDRRGVDHAAAVPGGVLRDRRLYRFAVLHTASFGFSVVIANWLAALLARDGHGERAAGVVAALTLLGGLFTRPAMGFAMRRWPEWTRTAVVASLLVAAAGTALLALPAPLPVLALFAAAVGLAAGIPFAPAFTGAQRTRPDAPAAAIGVVNTVATFVILIGTPLLGLAFELPGEGSIGFFAVAFLFAASVAAVPRRMA